MLRIFLYGMVVPNVLGLGAMATVLLPGGEDLTLSRLLVGCGVLIFVQVVGGYIGGRTAVRNQTLTSI